MLKLLHDLRAVQYVLLDRVVSEAMQWRMGTHKQRYNTFYVYFTPILHLSYFPKVSNLYFTIKLS